VDFHPTKMKNVLLLVLFSPIFLISCFKDQYPCDSSIASTSGWNYPMTSMPACYNDYYVKNNITYPAIMFSKTDGNFAFIQNDIISYYDTNRILLYTKKLPFIPTSIFYQRENDIWLTPDQVSDRIYAIDSAGNLLNTITKSSDENVELITMDNGYITIVNSTNNLRKYSSSGNLEWQLDSVFTYPSDSYVSNYFNCYANGDFVFISQYWSDSTNFSICRISTTKNIIWKNKFSIYAGNTYPTQFFIYNDNVSIFFSDTIIKLDNNGIIYYKGKSNVNLSQNIYRLKDGNFLQIYPDKYEGPPVNPYLHKYDPNGQVIWKNKIYSGGGINCLFQTSLDDIYILSVIPIYDGKHCFSVSQDLLLIKTNSEGTTCYK
jgi:hypothetical protein